MPIGESTASDPGQTARGKTVVVCLGNQYLRDDGLGIAVARELGRRALSEGVLVRTHQTFDLWLLSQYSGASQLIIVDTVKSGSQPGTVTEHEVTPRPGSLSSIPGLHSLEVHDLVDFASLTGLLRCPVTVIGVEPKDYDVGEGLSPDVEKSVPVVVSRVLGRISSGCGPQTGP
jgi:hydrogenase maturation protease